MAYITGKYQLDSQENFGEFLEHMGASPEKKKLVGNPNSQIEIILDDDKYTQVTNAGSKTFTLGEEYEQGPGEVGGKAKMMMKMPGDNVIVTTSLEKTGNAAGLIVTRTFTEMGCNVKFEKGEIIAKKVFKRI